VQPTEGAGVTAGQIVGLVLIVAGIGWMYIVFFVPQPRRTRGEAAGTGPWDAIVEIIKRLPAPYLPGALMIIVGALLVGLA
jgi:hypothetical protein